jgi:hypothetical protein
VKFPRTPPTGSEHEVPGAVAEILAELQLPPRSSVYRGWGEAWTLQTPERLLAVNDGLNVEAAFPLPSTWRGRHAVSPDLMIAVLSLQDRVHAIDSAGHVRWEVTHSQWGRSGSDSGSTAVTASGVVWATTPSEEGSDRWLALDLETGEVLGNVPIDCRAAGSDPVLHPDGASVGLSLGEGQDGSLIFWGRLGGGGMDVRQVAGRDRVLADIRPDGHQYLTTPHDGDGIAAHDLATGRIVARCRGAYAFGPDQEFDFVAGYLDQNVVIAGSWEYERHVLLDADTLAVIGEVAFPASAVHGPPITAGNRCWASNNWTTGRTQLLRLGG